jgi:hypothetical protein
VILVDESFNVVGESKGCVEGLALLACSQRVRIAGGGGGGDASVAMCSKSGGKLNLRGWRLFL